jgi:hypothetical protein
VVCQRAGWCVLRCGHTEEGACRTRPDSGAPDPRPGPQDADETERWLNSLEVQKLWPIRPDWIVSTANRADVRYRVLQGRSRGTYGAEPSCHLFHPHDVRQAAAAIAAGRLDIPSLWRTDTPDGQRAEQWSRFRLHLTCLIILLFALTILGLIVLDDFLCEHVGGGWRH